MKNAALSVRLANLKLANPTMLASGILGYSTDMLETIAVAGAGAVVTKSVGSEPRKGYANPTVAETDCGLINAIGLPNPGIKIFAEEIRCAKTVLKIPLIVSVFGFTADEYASVAKKATKSGADAVELNVSCPHVKDTGSEIGQSPKALSEVVRKVKACVDKPVLVKLSPNVTDIVDLARTAENAGADALTIMNTVKAMAIDIETGMPILANKIGGLSGSAVKPIALRYVYDVYDHVKLPIVGCGGIAGWQDAVEFLLAGASALQIGTAVASKGTEIFRSVSQGIVSYLNKKGYRSVNDIVGLSHCS